jgi:hypothetical protein
MRFQANRLFVSRIINFVSLTVLILGVNAAALGQRDSNHYKVEQLIAEGKRHFERGNYQTALDSFEHALSHCSTHYPEAYVGKGPAMQRNNWVETKRLSMHSKTHWIEVLKPRGYSC